MDKTEKVNHGELQIDLMVPMEPLENLVLATKFSDGSEWRYETDGIVKKVVLEGDLTDSVREGIRVERGSYVILFNQSGVVLCTNRTDYSQLVQIVKRAIVSHMN